LVDLHQFEIYAFRLVIAFIVGAAIGFERELRSQPAGLRTHILVCLGACLIATVDATNAVTQGKIAAQIVSGVGFLGAGAILRQDRGTPVHGLTTAASLWCVAGMGIAIGYGGNDILLGVAASLIVLLTLTLVGWLETVAIQNRKEHALSIYLKSATAEESSSAPTKVLDSLTHLGVQIRGIEEDNIEGSPLGKVLRITLRIPKQLDTQAVSHALRGLPGVSQFDWDGKSLD
jgi:putative Mg2+ transporter-C (MgtC) family protein